MFCVHLFAIFPAARAKRFEYLLAPSGPGCYRGAGQVNGECAEQAHLAPRLLGDSHAKKKTFYDVWLGSLGIMCFWHECRVR